MTLKRDMEGVGCQSALFGLTQMFVVITQMFRNTPHVINDLT